MRELRDDLLVLRGETVEPVQGRDDLVQGFGAQEHGERVDVALDVELAEPGGEVRLGRLEARARDVERLLRRLALLLHLGATRLESRDPLLGLAKAGLQRVELEQCVLGVRCQALVGAAEAGDAVPGRGVIGARPRRGDEESDGGQAEDREPSRTLMASRPHEPSTLTRPFGSPTQGWTPLFAPRREPLLACPACDCGASPSLRLRRFRLGGSYQSDFKTFV